MVLMITKQQRMFFCEKTLIYNYQSAMIGFLAILYLWKGERLRSEEKYQYIAGTILDQFSKEVAGGKESEEVYKLIMRMFFYPNGINTVSDDRIMMVGMVVLKQRNW